MDKYTKKPVTVEAIRYTGDNGLFLKKWSGGKVVESPVLEPEKGNPSGLYVQIKTIDSIAIAVKGDWVIKGIQGEFYPSKPDIFEATYGPESTAPLTPGTLIGGREVIAVVEGRWFDGTDDEYESIRLAPWLDQFEGDERQEMVDASNPVTVIVVERGEG